MPITPENPGFLISFLRLLHDSPQLAGAIYWDAFALSLFVGYLLSKRNYVKLGLNGKEFDSIAFLFILFGILGARLFHVVFEDFSYYLKHPLEAILFWRGGMVHQGGMIVALVVSYFYAKKKKVDYYSFLDAVLPPALLGSGIGRLGCLAAGCCYGNTTTFFLGIPWELNSDGTQYVLRHPVQLYELFVLTLFFFFFQAKLKKRKYPGQIIFTGLIAWGLERGILEFFRGDAERGFIFYGHVSNGQFWAVVLILLGIAGVWDQHKKVTSSMG